MIFLVLVGAVIIGSMAGKKKESGETLTNHATSTPVLGPAQDRFCDVVQSFIRQYREAEKAEANEAGLSQLRSNRKQLLTSIMNKGEVADRTGVVKSITTDSDGTGRLTMQLSCSDAAHSDITLYTAGVFRGIAQGTALYATLISLRPGRKIVVSGTFELGELKRDYVDERSITERGSMTSPEFGFSFKSISPAVDQASSSAANTPTGTAPPTVAHKPDGPSFDCTKARSRAEHLICEDPELSDLDASIARAYKQAKELAPDKEVFARENQAAWRRREATCFDKPCLFDWYLQRGNELAELIMSRESPNQHKDCRSLYAGESTDAKLERYRKIVVSFANRHGETEQEFYDRIGSSPTDVAAFALTTEECGASIEEALQSVDGLARAAHAPANQ